MKRYGILLAMSLLLGFAGCSDDDTDTGGGNHTGTVPVSLTSDIIAMTSRASGSSWTAGDKVGVYMMKTATNLVLDEVSNRQYTADAAGKLTPADNRNIYYPGDGTRVDFVAYYPWQQSLANFTYAVNVSDQRSPDAIDLLYSNNAEHVSAGENSVGLTFIHQLAKLEFTISAGQGINPSDLAGMKVMIGNTNTLADFNLSTGRFSNRRAQETVEALTATNGLSSQAIVIPVSGERLELDFLLSSGITFDWKADEAEDLVSGKIHAYHVTVGASSVEVSKGEISDWGGAGDDPTEGDGNQLQPPSPAKVYAVGDYYPDDDHPVGIVFEISGSGTTGKVVSFKELQNRWGDNSKDESSESVLYIRDDDNGEGATRALIEKRKSAGNFAGDYAIFAWIYNTLNDGELEGAWYLPAKHELMSLLAAMSGSSYEAVAGSWATGGVMPGFDASSAARTAFSNKVTAKGGTAFNFFGQYWAVTEISANVVWSIHFQTGVLQNAKSKGDAYGRARPIMKF